MPSPNSDKLANKKRLGRGLGSLLTTQPDEFDQAPVEAKPSAPSPSTQVESKPVVEKKITQEEPRPAVTSGASVSEALKDSKEIGAGDRVLSLPIEKVQPNKAQPRKEFAKEALAELAASIKTQGVLQPITVRRMGDQYQIIAGERRWRATQLAGLQVIPAIVKDVDDRQVMELALIENLQREDLNPVEEALGYQVLMEDYDLTQADLAERIGKSRSSIANTLRILGLPTEVRQWVQEGSLSLGHAKVLLSLEDADQQRKLGKQAMQRQWSVRTLELQIKNPALNKSEAGATPDVAENLARQLSQQLQKALGTKVRIQYKSGKGRLEVFFYSDEELSQLYQTIRAGQGTAKSK